MALTRNEHGKFDAYAWPGGYPIVYLCDGETLCPACANGENGSLAHEDADEHSGWKLVAAYIHWEGEPVICDHCGTEVESAYGNPEAQEGN
jgi:hypothetical protein